MRFVLFSSLQEFANSSWLQQHSLDPRSTARGPHDDVDDEDQQLSQPPCSRDNDTGHGDDDALVTALECFQSWTQELQTASAHSQQLAIAEQHQQIAPSLPLAPHQQLLRMSEALQQAAADGTEANSTAAAALESNGTPLFKALKQLAHATATLWTAAAESAATAGAAAAASSQLPTAAAPAAVPSPRSTLPASHLATSADATILQPHSSTTAADSTATAAAAAAAVDAVHQVQVHAAHQHSKFLEAHLHAV